MKICFLTHNLNQDNGAGVFSSRLIRGLDGFEKVVFTHEELLPFWRFLGKLRVIRNCDLIHALDAFPYGVLAVLARVLFRKKVVITAVGTGAIKRLYHPFYAPFLKWAYRQASRVIAVSNFTQKEILKKIPDLKIEVITHGVDMDEILNTKYEMLNTKIARFRPYILSVGALRWKKGYKFSVRGFKKIYEKFPDLKYVIIGKKFPGAHLESLKKLIQELGLGDRVFILEDVRREELLEFYRGAELFCLLSQTQGHDVEGFGLVFLEAAAAGLPVVGSSDSGIEDAVREGENGFLVESQNIEGFAEKIIKILSDPILKKKMQDASRKLAQASGWDDRLAEYAEMYLDTLSSRQG
jgi:phosphatidylinositol alpha-1,6-mannosyltransferase